jgi:hypothetical protein
MRNLSPDHLQDFRLTHWRNDAQALAIVSYMGYEYTAGWIQGIPQDRHV